jgi:hypothetical protein
MPMDGIYGGGVIQQGCRGDTGRRKKFNSFRGPQKTEVKCRYFHLKVDQTSRFCKLKKLTETWFGLTVFLPQQRTVTLPVGLCPAVDELHGVFWLEREALLVFT